jgi:hypothetical protein
MNTESQNQAILRHLRQGNEITPLDALLRFKCMRLASRINEIKGMGIEIADRWTKTESGKRVKAYRVQA